MIDSVTRIFVKFKTKSDREVLWGMWFAKTDAIDWATQELKKPQHQSMDDPFIGYELVYTNVVYAQLGKTYEE